MLAPTRTSAETTSAALDLEARLAVVGAEMDGRLAWASVDINIRTAHIETPVIPLTPSLQPEPTTHHAPVAQLLRQARTLIAAGWARGVYRDDRGNYCLQGALAAADTTGRHAHHAAHLLLEVIAAEQPHAEGLSRWNDRQASAGPVLRALDNAIRLADTRGI